MEVHPEMQYLDILQRLVSALRSTPAEMRQKGPQDVDAVNIGLTVMEFDLSNGTIPLLTTKAVSPKSVIGELLWFLTGESNVAYLHALGLHFWDDWVTAEVSGKHNLPEGDTGPIYGPNWVKWPSSINPGETLNQIAWLIDGLRNSNTAQWRRWRITAWNPEFVIKDMTFLAPCHGDFHCILVNGRLELHHFQRSGDFFVGVPFNIASYAILLRMICLVTGHKPGKFVQITSDTHMYSNCLDAAELQLSRDPRDWPVLSLNPEVTDIFNFRWPDDFQLEGYRPHPAIRVDVAL